MGKEIPQRLSTVARVFLTRNSLKGTFILKASLSCCAWAERDLGWTWARSRQSRVASVNEAEASSRRRSSVEQFISAQFEPQNGGIDFLLIHHSRGRGVWAKAG